MIPTAVTMNSTSLPRVFYEASGLMDSEEEPNTGEITAKLTSTARAESPAIQSRTSFLFAIEGISSDVFYLGRPNDVLLSQLRSTSLSPGCLLSLQPIESTWKRLPEYSTEVFKLFQVYGH